jgi:hypothetical protein
MTTYILTREYGPDLKVTVDDDCEVSFYASGDRSDGVASFEKATRNVHVDGLGEYTTRTQVAAFAQVTSVFPEGMTVLKKEYNFEKELAVSVDRSAERETVWTPLE